jgi:hypothetical protein
VGPVPARGQYDRDLLLAEASASSSWLLGHPEALIAALALLVEIVFWLIAHRRRRISYRIHMDEAIRLHQDIRGAGGFQVRDNDGNLVKMASLVLIRVSTSGRRVIDESDFRSELKFEFDGRTVNTVDLFEFSDSAFKDRFAGYQQPDGKSDTLVLPKILFNVGDRFKMLVLLSGETGQVTGRASISDGHVVKESRRSPVSRRYLVMAGVAILAVGLVVGIAVTRNIRRPVPPPPSNCVAGKITVAGSTAFAPTMIEIAQDYQSACHGATINVKAENSADGLTALMYPQRGDDNPVSAVMYDGGLSNEDSRIVDTTVAAISYAVVVNQGAGVNELTTAQLQAVFSGNVTRRPS